MTRDPSPEISGLTRRAILRNGVLLSLGTAAIATTSASLAGSARAAASASAASPDASAPEQWGWAWCNQCQGMWYPPNGGDACPYLADDSRHSSKNDYTSYNYGFYYNATGSGWQEGWLWCSQCSGMFWSGSGTSAGVCPANAGFSSHDGGGSFMYVAYRGTESGTGQPAWSWCSQCSGLWYSNGATSGGLCPVDFGNATHTAAGSSKYLIPHNGTLQMGPGQPD